MFKLLSFCLLFLASAAPTMAKTPQPTLDLPAFIEDSSSQSLVIWSDLEVPEDKSYESIIVMRGKVELSGSTQNLVVVAGSVHLLPTARVTHQMFFLGGKVIQEKGAEVGSDSTSGFFQKMKDWWERKKEDWMSKDNGPSRWGWSWASPDLKSPSWLNWNLAYYAAFIVLLCALFFALLVAPGLAGRASDQLLSRPLLSLLVGVLLWVLWVPILILLCLSIVGILFVPFYFLFSLVVIVAGFLTSAVALGRAILKNSTGILGPGVLGFLILFLVSSIPLVGQGIFGLATLLGSGAVVAPRFYRLS